MHRRRVLALLGTISAAGCLGGARSTTPTATPTPSRPTHSLRQSFVVGDEVPIRYRVASLERQSQVGGEPGQYLVITIEYKNVANRTVDATSNYFRLRAGETVYENDNDADDGLSNALVYRQVQPGEAGRGQLIFPYPDTATASLLAAPAEVDDGVTHRVELTLEE